MAGNKAKAGSGELSPSFEGTLEYMSLVIAGIA